MRDFSGAQPGVYSGFQHAGQNRSEFSSVQLLHPRFYVSTSKSIIKALINMHSFEIQLSPIG
ncbi:hypothetical protein F3Y36_26910 [Klebsiella pneumoniae]|nr:hypothetical protein F3Y36_26910 [Klebsiella pneumoniae]